MTISYVLLLFFFFLKIKISDKLSLIARFKGIFRTNTLYKRLGKERYTCHCWIWISMCQVLILHILQETQAHAERERRVLKSKLLTLFGSRIYRLFHKGLNLSKILVPRSIEKINPKNTSFLDMCAHAFMHVHMHVFKENPEIWREWGQTPRN